MLILNEGVGFRHNFLLPNTPQFSKKCADDDQNCSKDLNRLQRFFQNNSRQ